LILSFFFCLQILGNLSDGVTYNVSCTGESKHEYLECPVGPGINYTCEAGVAYTASVSCGGSIQHQVIIRMID
jgi:hypothetical protein